MAKKKKSSSVKGESKKVEDKIVKIPEKSSNIALTFYSDDRWNNWIIQVKESGFEIKDEEEEDIGNAGEIFVNMEDDVIRGATVIKEGEITWPPPAPKVQAIATSPQPAVKAPPVTEEKVQRSGNWGSVLFMLIGAVLLAGLGSVAPPDFMAHFTVFVLSCFVGYHVVWNVAPALHTPLMSVTNAISGIIVLGALLQVSGALSSAVTILAAVAILVATINITGGFLVTQRMLRMFKK